MSAHIPRSDSNDTNSDIGASNHTTEGSSNLPSDDAPSAQNRDEGRFAVRDYIVRGKKSRTKSREPERSTVMNDNYSIW